MIEQFIEQGLVVAGCLLVGGGTGYSVARSRNKREQNMVAQIGTDLPTLLSEYDKYKHRSETYFEKVDEVIEERNTWRDLYNHQAAGHENAQALMLETITKLVKYCKAKTGSSPKLDPLIETVTGEWSATHGADVREGLGDDGKATRQDSEQKESD